MSIRRLSAAMALGAISCSASAQEAIGSLKTEGVEISGLVTVSGGRATVGSNGIISTATQAAEVTLTRGGSVKICAGSSVRLSQPTLGVAHPPLLTALNRGAMEVKTSAGKNDVILTPDIRLEVSDAAPLSLRIRLVSNGDTCVDNTGKDAPILHATEAFGTGAYFIRPGQRVLFEHGSLSEVVDHETSNCGCPGSDALVLAGEGRRGDGKVPQTQAARTNPFPEAVSQGLQQPVVPQTANDQTHVQVSSTLTYDGTSNTVTGPPGETTSTAGTAVASEPSASAAVGAAGTPVTSTAEKPSRAFTPPSTATTQKPAQVNVVDAAPPPPGPNLFRSIGHFFRRLFGGH